MPDTERKLALSVPANLDDESVEGFFEELRTAIDDRPAEIDLDCSLLEHTTSRHVNTLWDALTRCERAGIALRLTSVGYGLERVLKVLDLAELFALEYEDHRRSKPARPLVPGRPVQRLEIDLEARIDAVSGAVGEIRCFLDQLGLSDLVVFDLETVFYEVATNICEHSGLESHNRMKIVAEMHGDEVRFEFTDAGDRFDPTGNTPEFDPPQAVRRRQSRGLGLVMIQRLMDTVSYERVDGRLNVVTLGKRLTPGAEVVR